MTTAASTVAASNSTAALITTGIAEIPRATLSPTFASSRSWALAALGVCEVMIATVGNIVVAVLFGMTVLVVVLLLLLLVLVLVLVVLVLVLLLVLLLLVLVLVLLLTLLLLVSPLTLLLLPLAAATVVDVSKWLSNSPPLTSLGTAFMCSSLKITSARRHTAKRL
jgi:hypothetical protein